jgi:hypothetical protein
MVHEAALAGQNYLDFAGTLVACWIDANPSAKSRAMFKQAEWKSEEIAKLIPTKYTKRSSKK